MWLPSSYFNPLQKRRTVCQYWWNTQVFDLIDCSCQDRSIGATWTLLLRFCRIMGYVAIAYYYITISRSLQGQHNILPSYGSASNSLTHKCQVLISNSIALEHLRTLVNVDALVQSFREIAIVLWSLFLFVLECVFTFCICIVLGGSVLCCCLRRLQCDPAAKQSGFDAGRRVTRPGPTRPGGPAPRVSLKNTHKSCRKCAVYNCSRQQTDGNI